MVECLRYPFEKRRTAQVYRKPRIHGFLCLILLCHSIAMECSKPYINE